MSFKTKKPKFKFFSSEDKPPSIATQDQVKVPEMIVSQNESLLSVVPSTEHGNEELNAMTDFRLEGGNTPCISKVNELVGNPQDKRSLKLTFFYLALLLLAAPQVLYRNMVWGWLANYSSFPYFEMWTALCFDIGALILCGLLIRGKSHSLRSDQGRHSLRLGSFNLALLLMTIPAAINFAGYWWCESAWFTTIWFVLGCLIVLGSLIVLGLLVRGISHFETNVSLSLPVNRFLRASFLTICTFLIGASSLPTLTIVTLPRQLGALSKMHHENKLSGDDYRKAFIEACNTGIAISAYNPMVIRMVSQKIDEGLNDKVLALSYLERPSLITGPGELADAFTKAELLFGIPERRSEAQAIFNKLEAKKDDWEIQLSLISSFQNTKQYDRALVAATNLIRLRPDYHYAYQMRSEVYKAMGDTANAEKDTQTYKKLGDN